MLLKSFIWTALFDGVKKYRPEWKRKQSLEWIKVIVGWVHECHYVPPTNTCNTCAYAWNANKRNIGNRRATVLTRLFSTWRIGKLIRPQSLTPKHSRPLEHAYFRDQKLCSEYSTYRPHWLDHFRPKKRSKKSYSRIHVHVIGWLKSMATFFHWKHRSQSNIITLEIILKFGSANEMIPIRPGGGFGFVCEPRVQAVAFFVGTKTSRSGNFTRLKNICSTLMLNEFRPIHYIVYFTSCLRTFCCVIFGRPFNSSVWILWYWHRWLTLAMVNNFFFKFKKTFW